MSEPVKHSEIEDVLSSIRRLVSDADRQPNKTEDGKSKAHLDRLVLTDALRVPESQDSGEAAQGENDAPESDPQSESAAGTAVDHFEFLARNGKKSQKAGHFGDDAIAGGGVTQAEDEPTVPAEGTGRHEAELQEVSDGDLQAEDAQPESDVLADARGDAEDLITGPAETGSSQPEPSDDEERPMFAAVASKFTVDEDAPWSDPEATLYEAAGIASQADANPYGNPDDIRPLTEKIAALEEVIGQTEDQWEPDDPGTDDYAGTEVETLEWEDTPLEDSAPEVAVPMFRHTVLDDDPAPAEEAPDQPTEAEEIVEETAEFAIDPVEPNDEPVEGAESTSEDVEQMSHLVLELTEQQQTEPAVSDIDEATMDEAALRQLVAEIVREELQGVLGERITRNVRKLVRREIHRALTLQELD